MLYCRMTGHPEQMDRAVQRGAAHPAADQRRSEGGERAVAGRAAGNVTRAQGDEGGSGRKPLSSTEPSGLCVKERPGALA